MIDVVVQHVRFDLQNDFNLAYTNTLIIKIINTKSKRLEVFSLLDKRSNPFLKFAGSS